MVSSSAPPQPPSYIPRHLYLDLEPYVDIQFGIAFVSTKLSKFHVDTNLMFHPGVVNTIWGPPKVIRSMGDIGLWSLVQKDGQQMLWGTKNKVTVNLRCYAWDDRDPLVENPEWNMLGAITVELEKPDVSSEHSVKIEFEKGGWFDISVNHHLPPGIDLVFHHGVVNTMWGPPREIRSMCDIDFEEFDSKEDGQKMLWNTKNRVTVNLRCYAWDDRDPLVVNPE